WVPEQTIEAARRRAARSRLPSSRCGPPSSSRPSRPSRACWRTPARGAAPPGPPCALPAPSWSPHGAGRGPSARPSPERRPGPSSRSPSAGCGPRTGPTRWSRRTSAPSSTGPRAGRRP
ncbi:MAG: hypothetical protein AVDCRST_MAG16-1186, partial [uncultured Frankineae bacterium]